jgi:hypothetical protein
MSFSVNFGISETSSESAFFDICSILRLRSFISAPFQQFSRALVLARFFPVHKLYSERV